MTLIIAGALALSAYVDGLTTYTVTKAVSNNPTHESVNALINNQILQNLTQDTLHEQQQNLVIAVIIAVIIIFANVLIAKYFFGRMAPGPHNRAQQIQMNHSINEV